MSLPVPDTNIIVDDSKKLIFAFQKPNILAFLSGILNEHQQLENIITDPILGYLFLIQLANAQTDTLNKYGKIVDFPRSGLSDNEYRIFILIKIAVDSSNSTGDTILNILQLASIGPVAVRDFDNFGFGSAVDIQGGYTLYPLAYINLLPITRGGGIYATYRYWTWLPAPAPNATTSLGLFVLDDSVGRNVGAAGFKDSVSGLYNNALASTAVV